MDSQCVRAVGYLSGITRIVEVDSRLGTLLYRGRAAVNTCTSVSYLRICGRWIVENHRSSCSLFHFVHDAVPDVNYGTSPLGRPHVRRSQPCVLRWSRSVVEGLLEVALAKLRLLVERALLKL